MEHQVTNDQKNENSSYVIHFYSVRITTDSPANEGGRLGLEGQAWSVTGAAFAQAKGVTAEARRVESRCYAALFI